MNTGPGLAPARLIALGSAALTEGFALIGFEARADPTPAAIEKLMQELQRNQQAALVVIEQSIARNPGRFLQRALREGGRIVITEIPEIHLSGSYCSRVESIIQSILGPEVSGGSRLSDADDIAGLESALAERARKLAEEHLLNGRQARDLILMETRQRLRLQEERETLAAKAEGERTYQQRVQATELELRARLDRLRWQLTDAALSKLRTRLLALAEDEARYLPLMVGYLRDGAEAIERDELVASVNARDRRLLQNDWPRYAQEAAPAKRLALSPDCLNCIGGVMVASADGNIRFDNTFEGRMERLAKSLQRSVAERLAPRAGEVVHG